MDGITFLACVMATVDLISQSVALSDGVMLVDSVVLPESAANTI